MILSIYAGMLRAGIPMADADETDLGRYLRVIGHAAKQDATDKRATGTPHSRQEDVIYLRRGTIDEVIK